MNDQLLTKFGWFKVTKVGRVNLYCEQSMPNSISNVIIKINDVVANLAVGTEVFLTVEDHSQRGQKGSNIILIPTSIICYSDSITSEQEKTINDIYLRTAQEFLLNGFYRGHVIEFAYKHLLRNDVDHHLRTHFFVSHLKNIRIKLTQPKLSNQQFVEYFKYFQLMYSTYSSFIPTELKGSFTHTLNKQKLKYKGVKTKLNQIKKKQVISDAVVPLLKSNSDKKDAIKEISQNHEHYKNLLNNEVNAAIVDLKDNEQLARLIHRLYQTISSKSKLPRCVDDLKFYIKYGIAPSSKGSKNKDRRRNQIVSILQSQVIISQLFALKIIKVPNPNAKDSKGRPFIAYNLPNQKEVKKLIKYFDDIAAQRVMIQQSEIVVELSDEDQLLA